MLKSVSVTISRRRKWPASRSMVSSASQSQWRIDEARGPREAAAVDEAGVILGVGEDGVAFVDERGNDAGVGGEAGGEDQRRLGAFELGEAAFQLGVDSTCDR